MSTLRGRRALFGAAFLLAVVCLTTLLTLRFEPLPASLQRAPSAGIRFTDRRGIVLREALLEGGRFTTPVTIEQVPPNLLAATICAEDKRFWSHHGIDPLAIARAAGDAARKGHIVSGASTITQQLLKVVEQRPRTL
ncbi:MAG: transglycosylase domain-containing protein, partial [Chthoniobacterales bacterium]